MAESDWKIRVMLFIRAADATAQNKATFGAIFANNGSGESAEDESRLTDRVIKLSTSGALPAQVYALETALLLPDMRDDMRAFLDTLPQSRYYVIANIDLPQYAAGDFIDSNKVGFTWDGAFTMANALEDVYNERGLQVIS